MKAPESVLSGAFIPPTELSCRLAAVAASSKGEADLKGRWRKVVCGSIVPHRAIISPSSVVSSVVIPVATTIAPATVAPATVAITVVVVLVISPSASLSWGREQGESAHECRHQNCKGTCSHTPLNTHATPEYSKILRFFWEIFLPRYRGKQRLEPFRRKLQAIDSSKRSLSSEMATRSCLMLSRWRKVTVSFLAGPFSPMVSKSTVTAKGVPASS